MRDDATTSAAGITITSQDFLWAVGSVCNLRRRLFDAALIQREFPPPHSAVTVVEALRSLELEVRVTTMPWRALGLASLPRLIFLRELAREGGDDTHKPALLAKVEADQALVFPAG